MSEVASETTLVDLMERGTPQRTSGYLIAAPRPALLEPGATRSADVWLQALERMDVPREEVAYVLVTHVHLDHGGGAGTLARHLPRARVVVHPRGARHLSDPTRLAQGARAVFGDRLERYWGLPEPVPESRLQAPAAGAVLDLGGGHKLRFLDAPGHARHQYMMLDEGTGALFPGDELGVRYPALAAPGDPYLLPSTAPNQFDPDAMRRSAEQVRELGPQSLLLSHFGAAGLPVAALVARLTAQIAAFVDLVAHEQQPPAWRLVRERLAGHLRRDLEGRGRAWSAEVEQVLALDLEICARGLADYRARALRSAQGSGDAPAERPGG